MFRMKKIDIKTIFAIVLGAMWAAGALALVAPPGAPSAKSPAVIGCPSSVANTRLPEGLSGGLKVMPSKGSAPTPKDGCTTPPTPPTNLAVTNLLAANCSLNLTWAAGASNCSGTITYNVYRDVTPDFTPDPTPGTGNLIASGLVGTVYEDQTALDSANIYYYLVRSVDSVSGEETNTNYVSGAPGATSGILTEEFEPNGSFQNNGWTIQSVSAPGARPNPDPWMAGQPGSYLYDGFTGTGVRFDMDWPIGSYPAFPNSGQDPGGERALVSPVWNISSSSVLTFWHTWSFENNYTPVDGYTPAYDCYDCYDGAVLEYKHPSDPSWTRINSFVSGGYNGVIDAHHATDNPLGINIPAWVGGTGPVSTDPVGPPSAPYIQTIVDIGTLAGPGDVQVRWLQSGDTGNAGGGYIGWYIDDVEVTYAFLGGACTPLSACTAPGVPTLVSAAGTLCGIINLTWTSGSGTTSSYNIYRSVFTGGPYQKINGVPVTGLDYSDTTAAPNTTYYYIVRGACDDFGVYESANSNQLSAISGAFIAPSAPGAPIFSNTGTTSLTVSWSGVSGAMTYDLYRMDGECGGSGAAVATNLTSTSYGDSGLLPSHTYGYYVIAKNNCGSSPNGTCASANTVPEAPIVNSPIIEGALSVAGTSTAPVGSTVTVYVNGTPYTTTVQSGGTWSVTVPALAGGDSVYASVTANGQTSASSATVTVTFAAPLVSSPILAGASSISGISTSATGTTITVYNNGTSIGTTTVQAGGTWTLTGVSGLAGGESITATAGTGATQSATSGAVIVTPPSPAAGNNGPVCAGSTLQLTASLISGASYSWTGPNGFASAEQNPEIPNATVADSGTYYVTATINGATSAAGMTVATVNPVPVATVTPSGPTAFCAGGSVVLDAGVHGSYLWSPNNETTQTITVTASGSYSVTVTDLGCTSAPSAATVVTVNPSPVVTDVAIQASSGTAGPPWSYPVGGDFATGFSMCINSLVPFYYLDVNTLASSQALLADTLNPFFLDQTNLPPTWTAYWAAKGVVEGAPGWQGVMYQIITGAQPMFYIYYTGDDYQLIDGLTYQAGGGLTPLRVSGDYPQWNYKYTGSVAGANSCASSQFEVFFAFNQIPGVSIAADGPTKFPPGGSVNLTATPSGGTAPYHYAWSPGTWGDSATITVTIAGSYSVIVTDSATPACSSAQSNAVSVTVTEAAPSVDVPIVAGATAIGGTSGAPVGTAITVYKNGASIGITTVQVGGTWTLTGVSGLVGGESITATAGTGNLESPPSAAIIVTPGAPTINGPLVAGQTSVAGTSTAPVGSTVTVYVNGTPYITTVQSGGTWSVTVPALAGGDGVSVTTTAGGQTSAPATSIVTFIAPAVAGVITPMSDTISGTAFVPDGTNITVYQNGIAIGTTTVSGGAWTVTGISGLINGASVTATAGSGAATSSPSAGVPVSVALLRYGGVTQLNPQSPPNSAIFVTPSQGASLDITSNLEKQVFVSGDAFSHDTSDLQPEASPLVFYQLAGDDSDSMRVEINGGVITITY